MGGGVVHLFSAAKLLFAQLLKLLLIALKTCSNNICNLPSLLLQSVFRLALMGAMAFSRMTFNDTQQIDTMTLVMTLNRSVNKILLSIALLNVDAPSQNIPLESNIYLSSCLSVCLYVCMNPVNGQAVGPILTKFGMGA